MVCFNNIMGQMTEMPQRKKLASYNILSAHLIQYMLMVFIVS